MPIPAPLLENLLGDCAHALVTLLASPDLNLDCLEPATREAIEQAHTVLQAVDAACPLVATVSATAEAPERPCPP